MTSYDDEVRELFNAIVTSRQVGNPEAALELAESWTDFLVDKKYVEPSEEDLLLDKPDEPEPVNKPDKPNRRRTRSAKD